MPKGKPLDQALTTRITDLLRAGKSISQIVRDSGASRGAVRNVRALHLPGMQRPKTQQTHVDLVQHANGQVVLLVLPSASYNWQILVNDGALLLGASDLKVLRGLLRMLGDVVAIASKDLRQPAAP